MVITRGVAYKRGEEWSLETWKKFYKENVYDKQYGWQKVLDKPSLESGYNCTVFTRESETPGLAKSARFDFTFTNCPNSQHILDFFTKSKP